MLTRNSADYGVDLKIATGITTGPAGVLVPGFLALTVTLVRHHLCL